MMVEDGINRIRDLLDDDLVNGIAGTGTTVPTESDTALVTPIAAAEKVITTTVSNKTLTVSHVIPSTDANGNDLAEWGTEINSGTKILHRTVTAPITKSTGNEVTRLTTFYFEGA